MDETITDDGFLGGRLRLRQPADGYRAGMDAAMLAAAAPVEPSFRRVLDAGCGVGAAGLCHLTRAGPEVRLVGVERDARMAELAEENIRRNGFADAAQCVRADVRDLTRRALPLSRQFKGMADGSSWANAFDLVLTNPPWLEAARADPPPNPARAAAHVEGAVTLPEWIRACLRCLRHGGVLVLAHRADRLDAALAALRGVAGDVTVIPLWPRVGAAARRVIIRARRGMRGPARLCPGLVLHGPDGEETPEARAILRDGAAMPPSAFGD